MELSIAIYTLDASLQRRKVTVWTDNKSFNVMCAKTNHTLFSMVNPTICISGTGKGFRMAVKGFIRTAKVDIFQEGYCDFGIDSPSQTDSINSEPS